MDSDTGPNERTPLLQPDPVENVENTQTITYSANVGRLVYNFVGSDPHQNKKRFITFVFCLIVAHVLAVFFIYRNNCTRLKVVSLNVWGIPGGIGGCKDKETRINAIARLVKTLDYELFLLQELWMQEDHQIIADRLPPGYHITGFHQLSSSACDGRVLPTSCSGLAIISRFPFIDVDFHEFSYRGTIWDGEAFVGKGVGRVRIRPCPKKNVTLDVFTTHLIAEFGDRAYNKYNNTWYRIKQAEELMEKHVKASDADAVVLGGDLNSSPNSTVYRIVREVMSNSVEDIFTKIERWFNPDFATYGNQRNTYSHGWTPVIYDYIFHKAVNERTMFWTNMFELPFYQTEITRGNEILEISLSDHEAVSSVLYLKKWSTNFPYM